MQELEITDILRYRFLHNLSSSKNREKACFIVSEMNINKNSYDTNLWIYFYKTKKLKKLTSSGEINNYYWYDNESIIVAKINKDKDVTRFCRININDSSEEQVFMIPLSVKDIIRIDDEHFIVTALYDNYNDDKNCFRYSNELDLPRAKHNEDFYVFDEIPFWHDDKGIINKKRKRIYVYNKVDGKVKPISDRHSDVTSVIVNKGKVLYQAKTYTRKIDTTSGLYIYDLSSEKTKTVVQEGTYKISNTLFLNDNIIFFGSDMKKYGLRQNDSIYIYNDKADKVELLKDLDISIKTAINCDCRYKTNDTVKAVSDKIYFTVTIGYQSKLLSIDLEGNIDEHIELNDSIDDYDILKDEIIFIGMRDMRLQELYIQRNKEAKRISHFNERVINNKYIIQPEIFTYESNGYEIDGFVLKPVGFDQSKKYPGILMIHGGPNTTYGKIFNNDMQCLANKGYFVFYTNPHGSAGRNNDFADLRGRYGEVDYEDLMNFTDEVLKRYKQIDQSRLGLMGGSYGGFMTNWIIGHTSRFKCAISIKGIANWIGKFATTDIGITTNVDQQAADPWTDFEKMWDHSPMKYADKVKTPTLFIHSEQDYRCWYLEGIEMFTSLMYNNVESKLYVFKGEGHGMNRRGKPRNRIKRLELIMSWFDKHLRDEG